jgi:hypothetical protein
MLNYDSKRASGVAMTSAYGAATLAIAGAGKILAVSGMSSNTVPVWLQVFDLAVAASDGAWATPPLFQCPVVNAVISPGDNAPTNFNLPLPVQNGVVLVLSTSATAQTSDTHPLALSVQFVPDLNAALA